MPKLMGIGKVTLKSEPKANRLSASQTEKNGFGAKPSFASNVHSLGYIFKYLPIKISHQILISKMMFEEPSDRARISVHIA